MLFVGLHFSASSFFFLSLSLSAQRYGGGGASDENKTRTKKGSVSPQKTSIIHNHASLYIWHVLIIQKISLSYKKALEQ